MGKNHRLRLFAMLCLAAANMHAMFYKKQTFNSKINIVYTVHHPEAAVFTISLTMPHKFTWGEWKRAFEKKIATHNVALNTVAGYDVYKYARKTDRLGNATEQLVGALHIRGESITLFFDCLTDAKTLANGKWTLIKSRKEGDPVAQGNLQSIEYLENSIKNSKQFWKNNKTTRLNPNGIYKIRYHVELVPSQGANHFIDNLKTSTQQESPINDAIFIFNS